MASKESDNELFIALGIGGTPSSPEKLYLIPSRMIRGNCIIHIEHFDKYLCPKDPDSLHAYINHYFEKRVR